MIGCVDWVQARTQEKVRAAEKLEPNQRGVERSCPNLQVTPRGGGGSSRQRQRRLQRPEPAAAPSASGRTGGELRESSSASSPPASAAGGWLGRSERAGTLLPRLRAWQHCCRLGSGQPPECRPAPPPLNAGGVRGSGRGGGSGGGGDRSGESVPPRLRFAPAALAERAPVAQDATGGHAVRPGKQLDAAAPPASALVPGGRTRSLQVIPRPQLAPPARSGAPTLCSGRCFLGTPGKIWVTDHS